MKRPCLDCGTPTPATRCPPCQRLHSRRRDSTRANATDRGYNYQHQRLRRLLLASRPDCYWCGSPNATIADHVVPLSEGGATSLGNLVPCCPRCNAKRAKRKRST